MTLASLTDAELSSILNEVESDLKETPVNDKSNSQRAYEEKEAARREHEARAVSNMNAIAVELAKLIPGTSVMPNKDTFDRFAEVLRNADEKDRRFGITLRYSSYDDKISAHGVWPSFGDASSPRDFGALEWVNGNYEALPTASVGVARDPVKAAKDIHRRMLAAYVTIHEKCLAYIERTRGDRFAGDIAIDTLRGAYPLLQTYAKRAYGNEENENNREYALSGGDYLYSGSKISTYNGNTSVTLNFQGLSPEMAGELLTVIARYEQHAKAEADAVVKVVDEEEDSNG